jgi:hypothetical protein
MKGEGVRFTSKARATAPRSVPFRAHGSSGVPAAAATDLQRHEALGPGTRPVGDRAPVGTMPRSRAGLTARTHGGAPHEIRQYLLTERFGMD